MPITPRMCIGKKAIWKPTKLIQKVSLPNPSDIILPVIFGNQ